MANPVCCLCGKECENQWGNNPFPVVKEDGARCCNDCNATKVVPARLKALAPNSEDSTIMEISDLLNAAINNNPSEKQIIVPGVNDIEETENLSVYLNESTGDATLCIRDEYEKELANDLQLLESVQERIDKKKAEIKNFIEKNKLGSQKTNLLNITYTSSTTTTSIDTKLLKSELPDVAAKYSKTTARASSIQVKLK